MRSLPLVQWSKQRIAASILRDGEGSTIFFDVIDTEEPILGDDAPLELRRRDRALLDQRQHLDCPRRNETKLDLANGRALRKTIWAHLSFRRQAEVDQRTQTQDLEADKIGVREAGQIVRAIYQSPSSAPAITSRITAEVAKIHGALRNGYAAGRWAPRFRCHSDHRSSEHPT